MYYIHYYTSESAHTEDYKRVIGGGGKYEEPWVDFVAETEEVHYNLPPIDWSTQYLTFKALQGGTFKFSGNKINYSVDGGETWTELSANTNTPTVSAGGTIMFKAALTPTTTGIGKFSSSGKYEAMGNPYSLLDGDNFATVTSLSGKNYALYGLFSGSTGLTSAENLSLPATTLANYCYNQMFYNCKSLTASPELTATTLAYYCYSYMFLGCTSLTAAPTMLPATTLAQNCYQYMFARCTSLTTAPELPATTLAQNCYQYMFSGCTSLTTAPELPATTLATSAYTSMFSGCISLTISPELPATTLAKRCYGSMFKGCTKLATAPELPATTLADECYHGMFENTNLLPDLSNIDFTDVNTVKSGGLKGLFKGTKITDADIARILPKNAQDKPCLPVTTLASYCYEEMFSGCTSLTTAPSLPATTLTSYCYSFMFAGCTSLTTAPELPSAKLAIYCYNGMFKGCTSLTMAPSLPATTLTNYCYNNMFQGCASLATAPELPATTLASSCYGNMFNGCTKLNYIKAMFTTTPSSTYTSNWVSGVASTGTFVKNSAATWNVTGTNGVPSGWTVETASA